MTIVIHQLCAAVDSDADDASQRLVVVGVAVGVNVDDRMPLEPDEDAAMLDVVQIKPVFVDGAICYDCLLKELIMF